MKAIAKKILVALFFLAAIVGPAGVKAQEMKKVMTTFYPVYYLAQRIAGDKMEVSMLLDKGQEAHDYETSAQDVAKVQESNLFIYQDDEMEHFVPDLTAAIDTNTTKVIKTTEGIELLAGSDHGVEAHDHDHDHEGDMHEEAANMHEEGSEEAAHEEGEHHHEFDPHTWLDPMTYAKQAENVRDAMMEIDPDNADTYKANAEALIADLKTLDEEYRTQLADLKNRTIVVQHAAFAYLCAAYDLDQVAITGLSTTQEPSAQAIAQMQAFMKETGAKTIFVDPALSPAIAETVASGTGASLLPFRTLESISIDELSEGVDYFSIMRDNLSQLVNNQ